MTGRKRSPETIDPSISGKQEEEEETTDTDDENEEQIIRIPREDVSDEEINVETDSPVKKREKPAYLEDESTEYIFSDLCSVKGLAEAILAKRNVRDKNILVDKLIAFLKTIPDKGYGQSRELETICREYSEYRDDLAKHIENIGPLLLSELPMDMILLILDSLAEESDEILQAMSIIRLVNKQFYQIATERYNIEPGVENLGIKKNMERQIKDAYWYTVVDTLFSGSVSNVAIYLTQPPSDNNNNNNKTKDGDDMMYSAIQIRRRICPPPPGDTNMEPLYLAEITMDVSLNKKYKDLLEEVGFFAGFASESVDTPELREKEDRLYKEQSETYPELSKYLMGCLHKWQAVDPITKKEIAKSVQEVADSLTTINLNRESILRTMPVLAHRTGYRRHLMDDYEFELVDAVRLTKLTSKEILVRPRGLDHDSIINMNDPSIKIAYNQKRLTTMSGCIYFLCELDKREGVLQIRQEKSKDDVEPVSNCIAVYTPWMGSILAARPPYNNFIVNISTLLGFSGRSNNMTDLQYTDITFINHYESPDVESQMLPQFVPSHYKTNLLACAALRSGYSYTQKFTDGIWWTQSNEQINVLNMWGSPMLSFKHNFLHMFMRGASRKREKENYKASSKARKLIRRSLYYNAWALKQSSPKDPFFRLLINNTTLLKESEEEVKKKFWDSFDSRPMSVLIRNHSLNIPRYTHVYAKS
jgi:hypothetical protein